LRSARPCFHQYFRAQAALARLASAAGPHQGRPGPRPRGRAPRPLNAAERRILAPQRRAAARGPGAPPPRARRRCRPKIPAHERRGSSSSTSPAGPGGASGRPSSPNRTPGPERAALHRPPSLAGVARAGSCNRSTRTRRTCSSSANDGGQRQADLFSSSPERSQCAASTSRLVRATHRHKRPGFRRRRSAATPGAHSPLVGHRIRRPSLPPPPPIRFASERFVPALQLVEVPARDRGPPHAPRSACTSSTSAHPLHRDTVYRRGHTAKWPQLSAPGTPCGGANLAASRRAAADDLRSPPARATSSGLVDEFFAALRDLMYFIRPDWSGCAFGAPCPTRRRLGTCDATTRPRPPPARHGCFPRDPMAAPGARARPRQIDADNHGYPLCRQTPSVSRQRDPSVQ